jgi:hypothetical protein
VKSQRKEKKNRAKASIQILGLSASRPISTFISLGFNLLGLGPGEKKSTRRGEGGGAPSALGGKDGAAARKTRLAITTAATTAEQGRIER